MKKQLVDRLRYAIKNSIPVNFDGHEIPSKQIESYIKSGLCTGLCMWVEGYQFNTHTTGIHDNIEYQLAHPNLY